MTFISRCGCSGITVEVCSTVCLRGTGNLLPFGTDAAVVSPRALLRALKMHKAHHTTCAFAEARTSASLQYYQQFKVGVFETRMRAATRADTD